MLGLKPAWFESCPLERIFEDRLAVVGTLGPPEERASAVLGDVGANGALKRGI